MNGMQAAACAWGRRGGHLGVWQHGEEGVDHTDAGAQHRHQAHNVTRLAAGGFNKRSGDCLGLEGQVHRRLVADERAQLAHQLAELVGGGSLVAQQPAGQARECRRDAQQCLRGEMIVCEGR
jgi:hypothetical protein